MQQTTRAPGIWRLRLFGQSSMLGLELKKVSGNIWQAEPITSARQLRPKSA
jgi:hypothetical protein